MSDFSPITPAFDTEVSKDVNKRLEAENNAIQIVNKEVNNTEDDEQGLACGVYELKVHRRDMPEDLELDAFIDTQLNFSMPTQSLINLIKKRDVLKTQKARIKTNRKLNEFERAEQLEGFERKQALLNAAINKARAQVHKGKTEGEI